MWVQGMELRSSVKGANAFVLVVVLLYLFRGFCLFGVFVFEYFLRQVFSCVFLFFKTYLF